MISVRDAIPRDARITKLYDAGFVCAVRRNHPRVGKRLTLERYCELPHLLIAPAGNPGSRVDSLLAARGLARRVVVRVHTFLSAPAIVASSDLVLTAPSRVLEPVARPFRLRLLPPPLDGPRHQPVRRVAPARRRRSGARVVSRHAGACEPARCERVRPPRRARLQSFVCSGDSSRGEDSSRPRVIAHVRALRGI